MKTVTIAVLLILVGSLAGCTGGVTGNAVKGAVTTVVIEATNFALTPSTIQVNKGDTVRLTLNVVDGTHNIAIPELDVETEIVGAGGTTTLEFVADKAGSFPFFCNVYCGKGHRAMAGTLVVK